MEEKNNNELRGMAEMMKNLQKEGETPHLLFTGLRREEMLKIKQKEAGSWSYRETIQLYQPIEKGEKERE